VVVAIALACAALIPMVRLGAPGGSVVHMAIENPSEYAFEVQASDHARVGWMPVGTAQPKTTTTFTDVYDQGKTWTVQFAYGSYESVVAITRADLQHADWRVTVPADLIAHLRAAHVAPTPVSSPT
jgi:hypothetical protein